MDQKYSPILITLLLIIWTIIVSPYSKYGDNWAIYPALITAPLVLLLHAYLIFSNESKLNYFLYALGHLFIYVVVWMYCLMKISKDSL